MGEWESGRVAWLILRICDDADERHSGNDGWSIIYLTWTVRKLEIDSHFIFIIFIIIN